MIRPLGKPNGLSLSYSRQKLGVRMLNKVNSSKRPKSINKENSNLLAPLKEAKVRLGPTAPKPGPILPKVAATELMELIRSKPSSEISRLPIMKVNT